MLRPWFEGLENRTVMTVVTWNTTAFPNGGSWDNQNAWNGGAVPTSSETAEITGLTGSGTVYLDSDNADSVAGLDIDSTVTLEVTNGSLSLGTALTSSLGGSVIVSSGASFNVGSAASVTIGSGQTLTDDGTVTFAADDSVNLYNSQIAVSGTMTAASDSFVTSNSNYTTDISVNAGGELVSSNSTFNLSDLSLNSSSVYNSGDLTSNVFETPIYVPYNDVQYLGVNTSFEDVYINAGTLSSGTLNLNSIGTNTAALQYVFASGFTVASGATLSVGENVKVYIDGQTVYDDGALSFATGDAVAFFNAALAVSGTMTAASDSFVTSNSNYTTDISVNAGGELVSSNSTFNLSDLSLNSSSVYNSGDLTSNVFETPIYVPYNDVQYLGVNTSFEDVYINAGTLSSGTLNLNSIGTNTAALQYVFASGFTVASGATLSVGENVKVYIDGQTVYDDGALSFATGDAVAFFNAALAVSGTMTAASDSFVTSNSNYTTDISVNAGGELVSSNSTFNLSDLSLNSSSVYNSGDLTSNVFETPIYVPYNDVQYLGVNTSFEDVYINAGTLSSGTLNLNSIGTNTAALQYVFASGFTVASGATLSVGENVKVYIDGQTVYDDGALSFATGDAVAFFNAALAVSGTMTAASDSFVTSNSNYTTDISVNAGGELVSSNSTFNLSDLSLNSSSVYNSGDLTSNVFETPIYVPYNDVQYLGVNTSFEDVYINAGTLSSGTLNLNSIGTNTAALQYVFASGFTVASGATLSVGENVKVYIDGQTVYDDGALSFATGDAVAFFNAALAVSGTMTAASDSFVTSNSNYTTDISVNAGGELVSSNSTFNLSDLSLNSSSVYNSGDLTSNVFETPIYVPYNDVQYLGVNTSFEDVYINAGTLSSGTLNLNSIGTNTAALQYVFASGFTVASGATLSVGENVKVYIDGQTVYDDGALSFATGDAVAFFNAALAVSGTMTAASDSFVTSNSNYTTDIQVNSGGNLTLTDSTYSLSELILNSGSTDSMSTVVFYGVLNINSAANVGTAAAPTVTGNDFSNVGTNGIVPSGNPAGTIELGGNYWGTTVPSQIEAKIDNYGNPNYPTVNFSPYISNTTGISASPASTTFNSTNSQQISLTATVTTSPTSQVIDVGTVTFTVYYGTEQIGSATTPEQVSNGSATATYTLPADEPVGDYTIDAYYSGYYSSSVSYLPASDTSHYLTVTPASTSTSVTSAAATFNSADDQSIPLTATVSSSGGTISEGTVTFTILQNNTPVGSSVSANVTNNQASASYDLLADTAGGNYTIQAVYTDPADFTTSTGTNTLTVSGAATTVTPSSATATFSSATGEGTTLTADVTSAAGTINQGAVTFTIVNSSGTDVVPPITVNVLTGVASENYLLPANTGAGTYTIEAVYDGTPSYSASLPVNSTLTISAAQTTTIASNASIPFNTAAQSVPLTASVTSPGGSVGGTVTFTVISGNTTIGSPATVQLSAGTASTNYGLPPGQSLGVYTIDAVYNGTTDFGTSSDNMHSLTITQPPASQLAIATPPSSSATAGQTFAVQPVIDVEDQYGNLATSDNTTVVTVSLESGNGTVVGTLTATAVAGVAAFTNLGENTAGNITLEFSTTGNIAPATSGTITISPAAASRLAITQPPSSSASAGQAFPTQPIVAEEDSYGNVITTDISNTVTAARGSIGSSTLMGPSLTVTLVDGVAMFSGLSYDLAQTMNISFTTSAAGVSSVTSNNIVVSPGPASQLVIVQQPPAAATAGVAFSTQPVIYEEDPFNNLETGDNSTTVTAQLSGGVGPLSGSTSVTVTGGVAPLYEPRRCRHRNDGSRLHGRCVAVACFELDRRQSGPGGEVGDRNPAFLDRDRRECVCRSAGDLSRGCQRQPRDGRQQLGRDGFAGQRRGPALWQITLRDGPGRNRELQRSDRQHRRNHCAEILCRRPVGRFVQHRCQPRRPVPAKDLYAAVFDGDGRSGVWHSTRDRRAGSLWESRDDRQQHRDRRIGEFWQWLAHGHAGGDAGGRNRDVHEPGRQLCRHDCAGLYRRRFVGGSVESDHDQRRLAGAVGDPNPALSECNRRQPAHGPDRGQRGRPVRQCRVD